MNPRTLRALRGGIRKWEKIVEGTGFDNGVDNCRLCKVFYRSGYCTSCPVAEKAQMSGCGGTPYVDWSLQFIDTAYPRIATTRKQKSAARAELRFLKSLLPKEKEKK